MARRSRKTLQTEGQLSLFAMTDDFLFASLKTRRMPLTKPPSRGLM